MCCIKRCGTFPPPKEETEQTDSQSSQYPNENAFYEKAEPEFVPIVQRDVRLKKLAVEGCGGRGFIRLR